MTNYCWLVLICSS